MSKELTVEELKTHLEIVLADVESGKSVTIMRNGKRIATIGPTIVQRGMRFPFRDLDLGSKPKNLKVDPVELLIEERQRERSGKKYGL